MKSVDEAMEEAFNELMNMPDEYFQEKLKEAVENPGVFGKMAQDGFVPYSVMEAIKNENR